MADQIDDTEEILDGLQVSKDSGLEEGEPVAGKIIPDMTDPKWSEYVLEQFEDDELIDGNPKTDGLRRVVPKILGPIISSKPVHVVAPSFSNNNHAMVVWEVVIRFDDGDLRTFGDVADVSPDNTDPTYAVYASATAATRAEGRALRKALSLKSVVAAEELGDVAPVEQKMINNGQIGFMDMMCGRLDINVKKLLAFGKKKQYNKIEDVPYGVAVQINKYLNSIQNGKQPFPSEIRGYDSNWRNQ